MSRRVEFIPDGRRVTVSPREVVDAWRAATTRIPAQFALGTAQHESDFTINEVDTEPSGFVSKGIFQLSDEEARRTGHSGDELLTLAGSVAVFAKICEQYLDQIVQWADLGEGALPPDVWPYIFIAHNQGGGACRKTIAEYGLDWAAYKERNHAKHPEWSRYGDDVISGGSKWTAELEQPRAGDPRARRRRTPFVLLDPGHGGRDDAGRSSPLGYAPPDGRPEKELTLELAHAVAARLPRARLTRQSDHNVSLHDRRALAHADTAAFVSLHASAGGGTEVYVHPQASASSRALADTLARALGGVVRASTPMAILQPQGLPSGLPACLIEADYEALARGGAGRFGAAVADALARFCGDGRLGGERGPGTYGVPGQVYPIKQPNGMACWATTYAMMLNWKEKQSMSPRAAVAALGEEWARIFDAESGLDWDDYSRFSLAAGLTLMAAQNLTVQGWIAKFEEVKGPIWIDHIPGGGTASGGHAWLLEGLDYDGTDTGTTMFFVDPWTGAREKEDFPTFLKEYEERFIRGKQPHVLYFAP